jgi:hypothetical protein
MWNSTVLAIAEVSEESAASSPIEVRDSSGFKGVFAKEEIIEDSVVFVLKGTFSEHPTRYTIELGKNRHLNFPTVRTANDDLDYCWQFLNHSCEPNGYMSIADHTFRASRTIRRGEEITFNYLTTESVMAVPFSCLCGSADCLGFIQGRNFLSAEQVRRIDGEFGLATRFLELMLARRGSENIQASR